MPQQLFLASELTMWPKLWLYALEDPKKVLKIFCDDILNIFDTLLLRGFHCTASSMERFRALSSSSVLSNHLVKPPVR